MEKRIHLYVSRKNVLAWVMALCMVCSAATRIVFAGMKGDGGSAFVWGQIVLPVAAALLYAVITLLSGKEMFYKTALAVWMMAVYFGIAISGNYGYDKLVIGLYWIALFSYAGIYTVISSGRLRYVWLLLPLQCFVLGIVCYLHRGVLTRGDWSEAVSALPDLAMIAGMIITVFAIQVHADGAYHPTWGDRSDGRRIRTMSPMDQISPYIMVHRNESCNLFAESIEITQIDRYIRQKRKEGMTNFGFMHVLMAAYCRGLCRYPAVNRFLSGQKVYTHGDDVQFCMTVKKEMSSKAPDTVIKLHLDVHDTASDIYNKMNAEIDNVKNLPLESNFDNIAGILTLIPGVFLKFTVWLLKLLDYFGLIPGFLLEISPFHGSVYLTSLGSLGIPPVFHHLYNFGNLPVFIAFGCKRHATEVQPDGTLLTRKYVDCRFTMDERICDGFYYASFFKHIRRILAHPEILDQPPEEVLRDID